MNSRSIRSWNEFERLAGERLRKALGPSPGRGDIIAHVVFQPSFSNGESWEVYQAPSAALPDTAIVAHIGLRRVWRFDIDYPPIEDESHEGPEPGEAGFDKRFSQLLPNEPTIQMTQFSIPDILIQETIRDLRELHLPFLPVDQRAGDDGVWHEVQFGPSWQWSRFRWWCDGPAEWKPLIGVVMRLLAELRQLEKRVYKEI
jgi:hypothetical protein